MKKIAIISVLCSLALTTAAYAEGSDGYGRLDKTQQQSYSNGSDSVLPSNWREQAAQNQQIWEQQLRRFEMGYDDSYKKSWDEYTAEYQRQKKIHH